MNVARTLKALAICLAIVGFCLPQPLLAAGQAQQPPTMTDVALQKGPEGNVLIGRVLDPQGAAQPECQVALYSNGTKLGEATTDGHGFFGFSNLRGGVYQVAAGDNVTACRAWSPGTAPPTAQPGALVVAGRDVVRGQFHPLRHTYGGMKFWLSHPCVIAGIIAAAVAIPVAVANCEHGPRTHH
jgi:hypothetical protein